MENLFLTVADLIKSDERFFTAEGKLIRNALYEAAMKMDASLIKVLLGNEDTRKHFFNEVDIDGKTAYVFDKVEFGWFVNNKEFLPDSYTRYKNKIGLGDSKGDFLSVNNDIEIIFPYKDCILEGGQQKDEESRAEIFFNKILAPNDVDRLLFPKVFSRATIFKNGEDSVITKYNGESLIMKGNNLLALYSLLSRFEGKIQLVNIDPPYNTGSDSFNYNDRFNHSSWLTFMKNRLEISRRLLKKEGFICCQVNESESYYLKVLMDEIFGKDNYLATLFVKVRYAEKTLKQDMDFHKEIEQILVYRKSEMAVPTFNQAESGYDKYVYKIIEKGCPKTINLGNRRVDIFMPDEYDIIQENEGSVDGLKEIWASGTILDGNSSGRFFRDYLSGRSQVDGLGVLYKVYGIGDDKYGYRYFTGPKRKTATKGKYYQGVPISQMNGVVMNNIPINSFYDLSGNFGNCRHEGGVEFRSGKKPEILYQTIIHHFSKPNDIVLDFFLGSGTTAAVAHKMGRRFIGSEQMDYGQNDSIIRMKNVIRGDNTGISSAVNWQGGGSFVYCELAQLNQKFVDELQDADTDEKVKDILVRLLKSGFISDRVDPRLIDVNAPDFNALTLAEKKDFVMQVLDANMLYVNYSDIDDEDFKISEEDKAFTKSFYGEE